MSLAYVSSPLDRADHLRRQPEQLKTLISNPKTRVLRIRGDQVECSAEMPLTAVVAADEMVFLGIDKDESPWFATRAAETAELIGLRALMLAGQVDASTLSILAQARSVIHWHEKHGYCAACGAKTEMKDAGYRRHCSACSTDHFPRTDPVVIMAVTWNEHVLLGRQSSWPPGMYSALAGFVEPGETIEQAARREIKEEAGVAVGKVTYHSSQPWPFPSSLMIGLIGEAESNALTIDGNELEDARWFTFTEARQMLTRQHPEQFSASHPYAIAHHLVQAAVKR